MGIDPVSTQGKICNFDCIYCQVGKTTIFTDTRKIFIPTKNIMDEIKGLPPLNIDYITFSGAGEPTLAKNLGRLIKEIKKIRKEKIAVLSNSSLIYRKDVQRDLLSADFVAAKLDAHLQNLFSKINRPQKALKLDKVVRGIKAFKKKFKGTLALQIMFVKENKQYAKEIAKLAKEINSDEIQINTPTRPCGVKPLSETELKNIVQYFKDMNYVSVYGTKRKKVEAIDKKATMKRRGT